MIAYVFLILTLAALSAGQYNPDMQVCWRDSYCRGVGTIPNQCQDGYEMSGALCYPKCKGGYYGVGPVCWQYCPDGWTDIGALCTIPTDIYSDCPWYDICGLTFAKGCNKHDCKPGYHDDGCTCRRPAQTMAKDSYGRTAGVLPICGPTLEEDAGLCYEPCVESYLGAGPVCWRNDSGSTTYQVKCNPFAYGATITDCQELTRTLKEAGITAVYCVAALAATIITGHLVGPKSCETQIMNVLPKLVNTHAC